MRIALTGGGTGGHFYPLIAVAEAVQDIALERTLIEPEMYYVGPAPFDMEAMQERDIRFIRSPAGRMRRYNSIWNIFGVFATAWGVFLSTLQLYSLYPDAVFSTGGFAAFPTLAAAKLLRIPCIIYDADAKPGRVSLWSSKFARSIGVAHPEAAMQFPAKVRDRIARVGHPIRKEIAKPTSEGGHEFLKLDKDVPTVFVIGGSQGARAINEVLIDVLPDLVESYNVIHQTGTANFQEVNGITQVVLKNSAHADRYRAFGLLNALALRMAAGISTIIVSRAGSGSIFEIASWGIPAILVPIPLDVSHDQTENAFSYARAGAAVVIEQRNLAPHILRAEIDRIVNDPARRTEMSKAAQAFARPDAARKIATILVETGLEHEPL
ncbi:MAG: UDP-N-acetylglucosamine--N-acetylmuramyl-(pentapeptide) pyrophosphoryl-UDP N-acetylglucosamine [Candidatus Kaiserbacteria bacterium]|nr:UDP-N-acetylglucosamine--N-acetylmuramyl-(pentapeptide) pyrophosphoryl-UDP N-acetylglucosamine [Candidatus Kaiserbacteria bacterium]